MGNRGCPLKQFRFTYKTVWSFVVTVNRLHTGSHFILLSTMIGFLQFSALRVFRQVNFTRIRSAKNRISGGSVRRRSILHYK